MDIFDTDTWKDFNLTDSLSLFIKDQFNISLSEDFIHQAVCDAGKFFGLPDPYQINESKEGSAFVVLYKPDTPCDDIVGYNPSWFKDYHIYDEDSFKIVMTHEAAHRFFQNHFYNFINPWEEELACDYLAAVRSYLEGINNETFMETIETWSQDSTHPYGKWRNDIMTYGLQVAETLSTAGNMDIYTCLNHFTNYLNVNRIVIQNEYFKENDVFQHNYYTNSGRITVDDLSENNDDIKYNNEIGKNSF